MSVIDNAVYVDGKRAAAPDSVDSAVEALQGCRADHGGEAPAFCWIGMLRPGVDEIHQVAAEFGLHALAIEDTVNAHQRPKLERYGSTEFVVLRPARYVDSDEVVEGHPVELRDGQEQFEVGAAPPRLEPGEGTDGDARRLGHLGQGQVPLGPQGAEPGSDGAEDRVEFSRHAASLP